MLLTLKPRKPNPLFPHGVLKPLEYYYEGRLPLEVLSKLLDFPNILLGVYHWLVLSFISYILAHWAYLSTTFASKNLPDWGQAAEIAFQAMFPQLMVLLLLLNIERLRELTQSIGIDIQISRCKI